MLQLVLYSQSNIQFTFSGSGRVAFFVSWLLVIKRVKSSLGVSSLWEQVPMPFNTDVFLLSHQLGTVVIFSSKM